jgi:NAD(P)-dependent dehydrogenase (short-subunit alcohol dehydrogenase family)
MGKGVAIALAEGGHEVIILCRSEELGESTVRQLAEIAPGGTFSTVLCDLTRLDDVRRAVGEIRDRHDRLDGVFINAGIGYAPGRVETVDGMDAHFQVNYLSQFMLTLHLLDLLENSADGGRVVFNAADFGELFWDDLQMTKEWGYERGIGQAMVAKRMLYGRLHALYAARSGPTVSCYGFSVHKTVWTNQLNIIPFAMRAMAQLMKLFGQFISIEECGRVMAPLFTEERAASLKKSGKLMTWKAGTFVALDEDAVVLDPDSQARLWDLSLELCGDDETRRIAREICPR